MADTKSRGYAVVGYPGAGKSTVGRMLSGYLDAEMVETGDYVRRGARQHFNVSANELSSDELGDYSTMRRETDGGDYVAQDVIEDIESWPDSDFPEKPVVIAGMRDTSVPELFEEYFDIFEIIWVHAFFDNRLGRMQSRGRQDESEFTKQSLANRDGRESMWGTSDLTFMADYKISNNGTEMLLRSKVENLVDFEFEDEENQTTYIR